MKRSFFTLAIVLLAVAAQAQIKVHSNGQVSLGTLTTNYGVQIHPLDYTSFRTQNSDNWSWVELSSSEVPKQKHWIVNDLTATSHPHTFYVTTDGYVRKRGSYRLADASMMTNDGYITNSGAVLDSIMGIWYIPIDDESKSKGARVSERRVGVCAQQVKQVLPEAVISDDDDLPYVDYEALTVFLIEAVKEQRQEIIELRKTLEENGLMKKNLNNH